MTVQIQELALEASSSSRALAFDQLVLTVAGRQSLSSRSKKLVFRLPNDPNWDFRRPQVRFVIKSMLQTPIQRLTFMSIEQVLPLRERFPLQGKLQRRWRRQKPQIVRFRLFGVSRVGLGHRKLLLAAFSVDLTEHVDRLTALNQPPPAAPALVAPDGSARPTTEPPRVLGMRLQADKGVCVGSHMTLLLDSFFVLKKDGRQGSRDPHKPPLDLELPTDRVVEMVRTVPLLYRPRRTISSSSSGSEEDEYGPLMSIDEPVRRPPVKRPKSLASGSRVSGIRRTSVAGMHDPPKIDERRGITSASRSLRSRSERRKLRELCPDDDEEATDNEADNQSGMSDWTSEDGVDDADDELESVAADPQEELEHRDAVIAALRAENRAQAALIAQLQVETRRLRGELALCRCRTPERELQPEQRPETDSEVAKRTSGEPSAVAKGRTGRRRSYAPLGHVHSNQLTGREDRGRYARPDFKEERVFEGLVQEIEEEFERLLPTSGR